MFSSHAENFAAIPLIAFIATILFCAWGISAMSTGEPMNDCVSQQGEIALCSVSPQGHSLVWQNFLYVAPQNVLEIFLAVCLIIGGFFAGGTWFHAPQLVAQHVHTKIRKCLFIIDCIRRALSRGIIQPQIYEFVIS